ncbi:MAG: MBL fold metallo-hydrolase [Firmicutes bacterium]|nr:MBL fold metallo-hydrolase [Bacillota bacterium]
MEPTRVLWILCLAGVLLLLPALKGRSAGQKSFIVFLQGLLYGGFVYGLLASSRAEGAFEAGLLMPLLVVNVILLAGAALWVVAGLARRKLQSLAVFLLVVTLACSVLSVEMVEQAGIDWKAWIPDAVWEFFEGEPASGELSVHFIDVGQGDAILIKAPEANVLIDGGTRGAGADVVNYLRRQGVSRLDIVIGTHPHEDHIGGLLTVFDELTVDEVWDPGVPHTSQTYENYLDAIIANDINFVEARAGMAPVGLGGGASLTVLHPAEPSRSNLNEASIVVRLSFGSDSFMFTGDAELGSEREILGAGYPVRSAVLKAGHHGSSTSTGPDFFQVVRPRYVVISCGTGNQYGHPHRETLEMLRGADVEVFRTDLHGTVVMHSDGEGLSISTEYSASEQEIFTAPNQ